MATPTQQNLRKRVVHQLDTPFSTVPWPEISSEDQDTILEMLCELLSPIGQHKRTHVQPSKGKRALKRKKEVSAPEPPAEKAPRPPTPELASSIEVGFNSISRRLEAMSVPESEEPKPYSMVFVARGGQSSTFNCHFPQMVGAASRRLPAEDKIRLVGFSRSCSDRLSSCLGIARVSSVAIAQDAPGVSALLSVVRGVVGPVVVPWLETPKEVNYQDTKIKSVETTVGTKRVKS
jgi:ribonuclease P/MRP protein subunit POP3